MGFEPEAASSPAPEPPASDDPFPCVPRSDPSDVIRRMQAGRRKPMEISAAELVPKHIHEIYAQIWRGEELERKAVEAAKAAYSWRGIRQRIWRSFVNRFSRPKGIT